MDTLRSTTKTPRRGGLAEWGAATCALEGETQSGDRHLVAPNGDGLLVAAADGLGHGDEAAAAAEMAVRILAASPSEPVDCLMQRCHDALQGTRGVALTLAFLDARESSLSWTGVGNVEAFLLRADAEADPAKVGLMVQSGVVGYRMARPRDSVLPLERGDTLILATDGIRSGFANGLPLAEPPQRLADRILSEYGKRSDDALVVVVRYLGLGP